VAIATRGTAIPPLQKMTLPWPEKGLSMGVRLGKFSIDLHVVHVPPGASHGWAKIEHFEAIHQRLATSAARPRILCGDFNSPKCELKDGTVVTWGHRIAQDGSVRVIRRRGHGDRWANGELSVLDGLRPFGFVDAFRAIHGYEKEGASFWIRRKGRTWQRRFDHMFATDQLLPTEVLYRRDVVDASLSDHAMMVARFRFR